MRAKLLASATVLPCAAMLFAQSAQATEWLQFGYDTVHSGFNRAEFGYSTITGNAVYSYALPTLSGTNGPGTVDGAPIFVGGVVTPSGSKNMLFGLTNNGTFYALDADSKTLNVLWSKRPTKATGGGKNTRGFGSAAIDPDLLHVYAYGFDGKIHKYQMSDGSEVMGGGWPATSTEKPDIDKGAGSLSIATAQDANSYLYAVTDGYIGDAGDYQGHLTAINLATGALKVFNSLCSDLTFHFVEGGVTSGASRTDCASTRNGIWGRPGAVYDAGTDRVFITTGNGPFNVNVGNGTYNWGDSVLALHPDGSGGAATGMPVDSYTPTTFQNLQNVDADLGSESIAILPVPPGAGLNYQHLGVETGKDGCVRLLQLENLSGLGAPAHTGGELQAIDFRGAASNCANGDDGPELRAQPAVWVNPAGGAVWVYVASHGSNTGGGFAAYRVDVTGGVPALAQQWEKQDSTDHDPTSPIVANGVVYYLANNQLRAYDAVSGTAVATGNAWTNASVSGHWQSPIIVNGRLYMFDNADPSKLWVFVLDGAFKSGFE